MLQTYVDASIATKSASSNATTRESLLRSRRCVSRRQLFEHSEVRPASATNARITSLTCSPPTAQSAIERTKLEGISAVNTTSKTRVVDVNRPPDQTGVSGRGGRSPKGEPTDHPS